MNTIPKRKIVHCIWNILCVFLLSGMLPAKASAAGITKLNVNQTYYSLDVTGDGRSDILSFQKIAIDNTYYSNLNIYVNGRLAYSFSNMYVYEFDFQLVRLRNGKPFLYAFCSGDNDYGPCRLLQYKKGKFKCIVDMQNMFAKYGGSPTSRIKSVKGNRITIRETLMTHTLGAGFCCDIVYAYKSGTLKRVSDTVEHHFQRVGAKYLTAGRPITVYKKPGAKKKKFVIQTGQKVYFSKAWIGRGKLWIQVRLRDGKNGWIPLSKKLGDSPFKEIRY